ncbi:MAG: hypothetical protein RIA65_15310, partial [Woeseia sp.]
GNDPRASSFEECFQIFHSFLDQTNKKLGDTQNLTVLKELSKVRRVPYEIPFGYIDERLEPVHTTDNTS